MFQRLSEDEGEKAPSDGPEVFIPVIIHFFPAQRGGGTGGAGVRARGGVGGDCRAVKDRCWRRKCGSV